ncbi:MAG: hypothetical protein FJX77_18020 [Armatimonadetes bacterium]|nr:hypothetical protein [Armatimonadota bacterium]
MHLYRAPHSAWVLLLLAALAFSAPFGHAGSLAQSRVINPAGLAVYDQRARDNLIRIRGMAGFIASPPGELQLTGVLVRVTRNFVPFIERVAPVSPRGGAFQLVVDPAALGGPGVYRVESSALCSDGSSEFPPFARSLQLVDGTVGAGILHSSFEIAPDGRASPFDTAAQGAPPATYAVTNRLVVDLHGTVQDDSGRAFPTAFRTANVVPDTDQVLGPEPDFSRIPFSRPRIKG